MEDIKQHPIFNEVAEAYCDCWDNTQSFWEKIGRRNLGFRASQAVSPKIAAAIMEVCCKQYNRFAYDLLKLLPDDCEVTLAREGSVCIYVMPLPSRKELELHDFYEELHADEITKLTKTTFGIGFYYEANPETERLTPFGGYEGEVRIWWD
jgi:hypothetical protein